MGQSADQLRQEIEQKREDAATKIDAIEARVQDTVQGARDTVQGTVQQARDTVVDTVEQTTQKVKESFDVRRQVEERPLLALGAALVGGFVLGGILGGDDDDRRHHGGASPDLPRGSQQGGVRAGIRTAARESGLEDTINNLASAFMGTMTERLRSVASDNFPALADKLRSAPASGDGQRSTAASASASPTTTDTMGRPTPYFSSEGTGTTSSGIPG